MFLKSAENRKEAAKYFDIKVLDHLIVSDDGYYSFADEGILWPNIAEQKKLAKASFLKLFN